MARAIVLMQPPTKITLATGYTQPDKDALLVGDAKTVQIAVEVYENALTGAATFVIDSNNDVDPTPFGYPSTFLGGGWVLNATTPASVAIATGAGTTGQFTITVTAFAGKLLRYRFSAGTGPLAFAVVAYLYDT
jgi:hypothetical protein